MTAQDIFVGILLVILFGCAIATSLTKKLLNSILIFTMFSLVMSVVWITLESPDLAITEAAVGAGVTTILFLATLKRIDAIYEDTQGGIVEKDTETQQRERESRQGESL